MDRLKLGQKIKRYRLMNDIRQEDMADKLDVSRATLINYEKGHTTINIDVLDRLKVAYPDFEMEDKTINKPKIIQDNNIHFDVLFNVLYFKKYIIILSIIICSIMGITFSFFFTKFYTAQISLYPAKKDTMQALGQFQSLANNFGMNMPDNNQNFNITDVVKSRLIANKVLNQKWTTKVGKKIDLYHLWKIDKKPIFNLFSNSDIDTAYNKEKAIKIFSKCVDVIENRMTGLIQINVKLEDPLISANIANFIGKQVQLYIQKENSAQSTIEKLFISERLSIVKNELEKSELELKIFKERNRGYEDSPELFMVFSRIFREEQAKQRVYLTLQQQLELARIEEVKQSPIIHILDSAIAPSRKSSPNRLLFLIFSSFIGLISSSLVTLYKY
ncbi:Wzz/FepE/Etk N-terminal domain-containing protein [Candidatus Marinimicrobia bacterium]|nr:Wzz/FepE/Etk N-terminal domain-containing protein [Candidatus Neomarinimicrobiota bacterium]